jgi:catechol 2,3-dioxygenase-like lactoylglutathione lyase family enzyme
MELTVAQGTLAGMMQDLLSFYCSTLGFSPVELDVFPKPHVFLTTDTAGSQFIYIAEHAQPMLVGGEDHLGFHMQDRAAVDRLLQACQQRQLSDHRMQIKELEDLDLPQTVTHAFYFRYLLPIWFDIQVIEFKPGFEPKQRWTYG